MLPIVFWMFVFTTIFPNSISKLQFVWGILIGAFSSLPFVFHQGSFLWGILENIFSALLVNSFFWVVQNLSLIFISLIFVYFIAWYFFQDSHKRYNKIFLYSGIILFWIVILGSLISLGLQTLLPNISQTSVGYGWIITFVSVGWIFAYYIVIALIEEGNKYISSLSFSGKRDYFCVLEKYLALSACVALGFSFFENMVYAYFYLRESWVQFWLLSLVFFRSIFTIILHLMSSILFALGFWYVMRALTFQTAKNIFRAGIFIFLGIMSHVLFDSALVFWYMAFLLFYIFLMYLLISYISPRVSQSLEHTESL